MLAGPSAAYAFGGPDELTFEVELDRCVSFLQFSFHRDGWHPYTAAVRQLAEEGTAAWRNSVLREYFECFRPTTQCELYFETACNRIEPLNRRSPYEVPDPWCASLRRFKDHGGLGNQNFGPIADALGEREVAAWPARPAPSACPATLPSATAT